MLKQCFFYRVIEFQILESYFLIILIKSATMYSKNLDNKISACKELTIRNLEKAISDKMVHLFLKDRKVQSVTQIQLNLNELDQHDGSIQLEFYDHQSAWQFYERFNFKDKIFQRKLNLSLFISLNPREQKKFYLQGLTNQNQRQLFEAARKVGICKIDTKYENESSQICPDAMLSFARQESIGEKEFNFLKQNLENFGITISREPISREQSLENKILNCKDLVIQDLQRSVEHKDIIAFLRDKKLMKLVTDISINQRFGFVRLKFQDHQQALSFYDENNFRQKIAERPLNIYFDIPLLQNQMKQYCVQGITKQKIQILFQAARKIGICKIKTNYQTKETEQNSLKTNATIFFLRKETINPSEFKVFVLQLQANGISIAQQIAKQELPSDIQQKIGLEISRMQGDNWVNSLLKQEQKIEIQKKVQKAINDKEEFASYEFDRTLFPKSSSFKQWIESHYFSSQYSIKSLKKLEGDPNKAVVVMKKKVYYALNGKELNGNVVTFEPV